VIACDCCRAFIPPEQEPMCDSCYGLGCDPSLDSVQCRPEDAAPPPLTALQQAVAEGRWEDAADLIDKHRNETPKTVGPPASFAREPNE
jgi:hypothetical protein